MIITVACRRACVRETFSNVFRRFSFISPRRVEMVFAYAVRQGRGSGIFVFFEFREPPLSASWRTVSQFHYISRSCEITPRGHRAVAEILLFTRGGEPLRRWWRRCRRRRRRRRHRRRRRTLDRGLVPVLSRSGRRHERRLRQTQHRFLVKGKAACTSTTRVTVGVTRDPKPSKGQNAPAVPVLLLLDRRYFALTVWNDIFRSAGFALSADPHLRPTVKPSIIPNRPTRCGSTVITRQWLMHKYYRCQTRRTVPRLPVIPRKTIRANASYATQ